MPKFKKGDIITAIEHGRGFEWAYVAGIYKGKHGKFKNREMYFLKIMNGTATVPVSSEVNYKLLKR